MALEAAFEALPETIDTLRGGVDNLLWSVTEAKPAYEDHVLAGHYADAATELAGLVQAASVAAGKARELVRDQPDLTRAGRMLASCQDHVQRMVRGSWSALASFERIAQLTSLAQERRGEWVVWAAGVMEELQRCQEAMHEVSDALVRCWREIAERVGMTTVSVQATGIGHQTLVPTGRANQAEGKDSL